MNETRALFIEFRVGISGGLEFGLEPKLGLLIGFGGKIKIKWCTCDQMRVYDGI